MPSQRTLELLQQRQEIERQLELLQAPKPTFHEKPTKKKTQEHQLLDEIHAFKREYLSQDTIDPKVIEEISWMEQKLEHRQPKEERVLNPKDELERLKLDHAKHMAYLQFEKERVLSQHELEQIKLEFEKKEEKEEKKHTVVSIDWTGLKTTQYNPTRGFAFVLQYLQGMTEFASHIQICYCLFEGQTSLQQAQHIGPLKVESSSRSFNCSIQSQQLVYGVHASQEVKLYIDIRSYPNGQQRHSAPIGWTIIEPFDNKNILQSGDWKTRLFSHPIIFDKPLQVLMKEKPLNGMHLYLTIVDTCHPHILGRRLDVFPDQFVFHAQMGPNQIEFTEPFKQEKSSKKTSSVKIKKKEIQEVKEEQELVDDLVIITGEPEQQQAVEEKQEEQVQLENVYPLGMQLNTIGNLFTTEYPRIRISFVDLDSDMGTELFVSEEAEPSIKDGVFGWQFGSYCVLQTLQAQSGRRGKVELILKNETVGAGSLDLFKFHEGEPFDVNDGHHTVDLIGSDIRAQLQMRIYKPHLPPPQLLKFTPKLVTPPVPIVAWQPVETGSDVLQKPKQAITIFVDQARFLPENVSATKLIAKIYNPRTNTFAREHESTNELILDAPVYFPKLETRLMVNSNNLSKNTVLLLELHTYDKDKLLLKQIGVGCFSLMDTSGSKVMIGNFQIPIFTKTPSRKQLLFPDAWNVLRSRTPCASILLRIFNGPTTAEMAGDPPPYKQGLYQSTQFSKPSTYEEYLYHFVFKERKSFTVRDRLLGLENLPNSAKQTENSLIAWINMQLSKPIADGLDLSYIVKYDPSYGFKLSIDCAFNLETDGFTIAVTSLSSIPFLLEQELPDKRYPNDLMYTKSIDYQSQIRNPKWNDGFVWYRKRPLDMETVAVIELFTISLNNGEPEISENGWTIFNPFLSNGYARHGRFRLPLFNGSPNGKAVSFYRRQDPENCLDEALKQGFARLTSNVGSIIVRSCDGRRADEVPLDFDLSNIFLGEKSSLFRGAGWSQKPIQSLVKNMDPSDFDRKIYEIFTDVTNLPFIP